MNDRYSSETVANVALKKKPRILLNVCTHGTERVGLKVAKEIVKIPLQRGSITIHIANKKALEERKRFITHDLNRVFPGNPKGGYEERLAHEMLPFIRSFDIVIDIHSTETNLNSTIITTRLTKKIREFAGYIAPKQVVVMKATKSNALISSAKIGLAFEYGKDKNATTLRETISGIKRLLIGLKMIKGRGQKSKNVKFYTAYTTTKKPKGAIPNLAIVNYKKINKGDVIGYEKDTHKPIQTKRMFYPILYGNNSYETIFGFEGRLEDS